MHAYVYSTEYDRAATTWKSLVITKIILIDVFFFIADITPEEIFNMFFGGFGGASMSGGKEMRLQALL